MRLPNRLLTSVASVCALLCLPAAGLLAPTTGFAAEATAADEEKSIHHVRPEACKKCHEEIYEQWSGSMHANSSALKDPIHAAFYQNVMGDPLAVDLRDKKGNFPVCLKCHAPIAAFEQKTKLDEKEAYANGIGCTTCHSITAFKGSDTEDGKPLYGVDAYHMDTESLHGPSGITYTTERTPDDATWPTPVHHPQPMKGNQADLFKSNAACMGCHEKRHNSFNTPLCVTGKEYRDSKNFAPCQACHMGVVTVPKLDKGKVVEGEFVTIADHSMNGGHDAKMVARGLLMTMDSAREGDTLKATITLKNRLPHDFPTGAPFRNVFIKVAAYDAAGQELWKNYKVHPIMDDPQAALWYALGDAENKPTIPPKATQVLADTRLKPNEERSISYDIPVGGATAIVRAEAFYDLLLPPLKASMKDKLPAELLQSKSIASIEIRL